MAIEVGLLKLRFMNVVSHQCRSIRLRRFRVGILLSLFCLLISGFGTVPNLLASSLPIPVPTGVVVQEGPAGLKSYLWDFGRDSDQDFDNWPDGWERYAETGYPEYVAIGLRARDRDWQEQIRKIDSTLTESWSSFRSRMPNVIQVFMPALLPSVADALVDRTLAIRLDGGLARVQSPPIPTSPTYKYRFSVDVRTQDLQHDHVLAEVLFFDDDNQKIGSRYTETVTQTRGWHRLTIDDLIPPQGASKMHVRLHVRGGSDGLEDIRGQIEFDNVRFRQFPQLVVTTDRPLGVYTLGQQVTAIAELLGMPSAKAKIRLRLKDIDDQTIRSTVRMTMPLDSSSHSRNRHQSLSTNRRFKWTLDDLDPGFYVISARMEGDRGASLASRTTLVIVDPALMASGRRDFMASTTSNANADGASVSPRRVTSTLQSN
ncbi:MAG: hypothetical protein AAF745_06780, partial [Planctomycetota bacterium]